MMDILWWQILLLTLYAGYQILDELQIYSSLSAPVFAGLFAGLVMGDLKAGLIIGGSMQLTVLGVGTFGGASKIDANDLGNGFLSCVRDESRAGDCRNRCSRCQLDDSVGHLGAFCEYVFCPSNRQIGGRYELQGH
jgi:hypothetical protein